MNKILIFIVALLSLSTLSLAGSKTPDHFLQLLREKHGKDYVPPRPNYGFEGVITQEDWDRSTRIDADPPVINATTLHSELTGFEMETFWGDRTAYCFQGLPFAKKKPDRFKPPEALVEPDFGLPEKFMATHLPEKCSQHGLMFPDIPAGSEDCLYLNVYIPKLPFESGNFFELLPVMIFFHGGAFLWGDSSLYLPTRLLERDVILVVPHYRLGSFGFFTTMDERAPGNIALYDQRMAMMWVQEHISDFGGDKDRVTIFGQSAGGASVNYHLLSNASTGLFKNVIGESGSAIEHWSLDPDPIASAMAVGEINGCDTTSIDTVYDCMIALPEGVVTLGINELSLQDRVNGGMGFRGVAPIIQDPSIVNPMVYKHPKKYYTDMDFNRDVNLMIGANKHEGSFVLGLMYSSYMLPNGLETNETYIQEGMVEDMLSSFGIEDYTNAIAESFWEDYLWYANRRDFPDCTDGMIDMSGVLFEKAGAWETAKLHSYYKNKKTDTKTFFYSFDFESDDTMFGFLFLGQDPASFPFEGGVTHSDELLYLFSWPAVMDGMQYAIMDRLVVLWTNFATYGDPTPDDQSAIWNDALFIPKWKQVNIDDGENYMLMEAEFTNARLYPDRWTIAVQDRLNMTDSGGTTVTVPTVPPTTTMPGGGTTKLTGSHTDEEYDDLENERDAYMATMIVFIVFFVLAALGAGFCFWKWRY